MRKLLLPVLLLCGATAFAAEPQVKKYTISTTGSTPEVKVASEGTFAIVITPTVGDIKPDTPLKIVLSSPAAKFEKEKLAYVDGKKADGKLAFTAKFTPTQAGPLELTADCMFFVCTAEICERFNEKVALAVSAK